MGDSLWSIDATLTARGFELVRPIAVYRGPIFVHGNKATVEIDVSDHTFANMPTVKLVDHSKLPVRDLAHLIGDSLICYVGEGGLPLDLYDPGGSVLRVLLEAEAALERSFGGRAKAEFEMELASYWQGRSVYFALPGGGSPAIIHGEMIGQSNAEDAGIVIVGKGQWDERKSSLRAPVTVLRFAENLRHTTKFPLPTLAAVIDYIAAQPNPPAGWKEAVLTATALSRDVFLAAPNAIIGWSPEFPPDLTMIRTRSNGFRANFFRRAMEGALHNIGLDRVTGNETDLRHCVERNLIGQPSLVGKTIAVIGCGTIGGYLARLLAQSGAGCEGMLYLYDTDTLRPGNLGRHLLGFNDLGKPKAKALVEYLRTFHPDVAVTPCGFDATKAWSALERVDLIIDATGEPNVSTVLNDLWIKSDRTGEELALLHTWVFGNGVAAQSFLNLKDGHACYRCLKTGFDGQWRYNPMRYPNSPLLQAPARCGEAGYIPFGVDAPVAAASLTLRAALDWAGNRPGKRLRTTIVDHEAGREKVPWASPDPLKDCPACGG